MTERDLDKLKKEAIWPLYICTKKSCVNSVGDRNYELAFGLEFKNAPATIKCPSCHSAMKLANKPKK